MGIDWRSIQDMTESEGLALLDALDEILNPGKTKTYKVKKRQRKIR